MHSLPPGPRFALLQFPRLMYKAHGLYRACAKKYGDPFTVPLLGNKAVVTGDPEGIREIFTAKSGTFDPWIGEMLAPVLGEHALVIATGEAHRRDRKLMAPPLHGDRMRTYGTLVADAVANQVKRWQPGVAFPMLQVMQEISIEVIIGAVFGVTDPHKAASLQEALLEWVESLTATISFVPWIRREFGGFGPWARYTRAKAKVRKLLKDEMTERRRVPADRQDILSLLMSARYDDGSAMSDEQIYDEMMMLLGAGYETTAIGLTWAFYRLCRDSRVRSKLLAELDAIPASASFDEIATLPYLSAVCQEVLRMYPVSPDFSRYTRQPFSLKGYEIPAGVPIFAAVCLTHYREDIYPDSESFRPERFLERRYSPYEYLPFGGGVRRCIGAAFAQFEMAIVLSILFREHRYRLVQMPPPFPRRRSLTLGPSHPIPTIWEGPRSRAQ